VLRGLSRACIAGATAVSLNNLTNQLRRDLTANPKKAAALALMVAVALYFWGPLAWKFIQAKSAKQNSKANMASLILTDDPVEPSQQAKGGSRVRFKWERVRQLIQQDPHMVSAKFDATWVDPFGKPAATTTEGGPTAETSPEEQAAVATAAAARIDPQSLGLTLSGIMISQRSKLATINGETCHEGEILSVADKGDKSLTYELRVLRISRQSVQLDFGGQIFSLELSQPRLAHGDDFQREKPKERKQ
jgi:hypothetical protein